MSDLTTEELIAADKRFLWHPFTDMRAWTAANHEPIVLVEGRGAILRDSRGREYIDGNSSGWTNIHGHNHPRINTAIREQLDRVAHTSLAGFSNPVSIQLAKAIVDLLPPQTLTRVFYSDDGSTGVEVALRVAQQFWRLRNSRRSQLIAFQHAYHGDTAGAASLGAAAMFQLGLNRWNFPVTHVPTLPALERQSPTDAAKTAAVIVEPVVQAAAGIRIWPPGTLAALRRWCDRTGALLIFDEVLTGFGRTGRMFGWQSEGILPDIMVLGKGLGGGYLPIAVTLVTEDVFRAFDGSVAEGRALAYGHSYSGNALSCAAALASLHIFAGENVLDRLQPKIEQLGKGLAELRPLPGVADVRQCGFIAGIEMRAAELAQKVCQGAAAHGLLVRPIRNVVALSPPLCTSPEELGRAIQALRTAITG